MKSNSIGPRTTITLIATLIAICFSAATTHAQSGFQAKLMLPYEVHWGAAVLRPGNYLLTFNGDNAHPVVIVRDAETYRPVALERAAIEERSTEGKSALLIGMRGRNMVVDSFRIAELGQLFVYHAEPAQRRAVEEARKPLTVPIVVAER